GADDDQRSAHTVQKQPDHAEPAGSRQSSGRRLDARAEDSVRLTADDSRRKGAASWCARRPAQTYQPVRPDERPHGHTLPAACRWIRSEIEVPSQAQRSVLRRITMKRSQQSVPAAETGRVSGDYSGSRNYNQMPTKGGRNATTSEGRRAAGQ